MDIDITNIIIVIVIIIIAIILLYYFVFKNSKTSGGWELEDLIPTDDDDELTLMEKLEEARNMLRTELTEISEIDERIKEINYYRLDEKSELIELRKVHSKSEEIIIELIDIIFQLESIIYKKEMPPKTKQNWFGESYSLEDAIKYINNLDRINEINVINEDTNKTLDETSMHEVMKYVNDMKDVKNISSTNKENGRIVNGFRYNPVPINPGNVNVFNGLKNIHAYSFNDVQQHLASNIPIYVPNMFYEDYVRLKQQGNEPGNIGNITLTARDIRYCYEHAAFQAPFNFGITLLDCVNDNCPLTGIRSLNVPNGVTIIGRGCFANIRNATINIPATVSLIDRGAFDFFSNNTASIDTNGNTVIIDPNNPYYKVENNKIVRK
jgi:hypothetical protein